MSWYQKNIVPRLLISGMNSKRQREIRRAVLAYAKGAVLEIGIGPGYNIPLYKNISKLYALEPSKELLCVAKSRPTALQIPLEFIEGVAEEIPLPNSSVDTVVSTWTMCSVSEPLVVLREIQRVLRPQGIFIFIEHGASPNFLLRIIQTMLTSLTKHFTGNCHYDRKIEDLLREAGFSLQRMDHPTEKFKPLIYNYQGIAQPRISKD